MTDLILTNKQQKTVSRLKSSSWNEIKPLDISLLIPKIINNKKESGELIPKIVEYEKIKNPTKSIQWIEKVLDKKLKTKDDKKTLHEILLDGDYSSFPATDKPAKKKGLNANPITNITKKSGSDQQLNDKLDSILKSSVIKETPAFGGPGTKLSDVDKEKNTDTSIDFSTLFKTGNKSYTDNKALIDSFKKNLTKEKLADGSWLTGLASLSYPEIQILQDVINLTPLGLSSKDKANLENILSKDKSKADSVSTYDGIKTILKSFINPDAIGTILKTRGDQITADASEGLDKWWRKATGSAPKKNETLGALEDIIGGRIKTEDAKTKRQQEIDILKGKKPTPVIPVKEVDKGIVGLKPGMTIDKFKPVGDFGAGEIDKTKLSIADILKPPTVPGIEETSAGADFLGFLKGIFVPSYGLGNKRDTPEGALEWLKTNNPSAYSEYNKKKFDYDKTVKKAGMSIDSEVDMTYNKDEVLRAREFTRDLLKQASDLKQLTDQEIEDIYDISATLESVLTGDSKITYKDLDNLTLGVINMIPEDILQAGNALGTFLDSQLAGLKSTFKGDSTLTNFDSSMKQGKGRRVKTNTDPYKDGDDKEPKDPKDPKDPKKEITETTLDKKESSKGDTENTTWSDLRPRMKWGGTDEMFIRSDENVNMGNLVAAARAIEEPGWGNGNADNNDLFKRTLKTDSMQFTNTTPMPQTMRYANKYNTKKKQKGAIRPYNQNIPTINNNSYFGQTQHIDAINPFYYCKYKEPFIPFSSTTDKEFITYENLNQAVFTPVLPDAGIQRNFYNETYSPAAFNQFLSFTAAYPQTAYQIINEQKQYAYYPDNRNYNQGMGNENLRPAASNYIKNKRFTQ
jgi:hypothetical protein